MNTSHELSNVMKEWRKTLWFIFLVVELQIPRGIRKSFKQYKANVWQFSSMSFIESHHKEHSIVLHNHNNLITLTLRRLRKGRCAHIQENKEHNR